ncbi:MAG: hypothetical protein LRY39_00615 [Alphaproteobacteria bacterium]|nr:hypothetical protein [Alphaproteobacteria bacterium]
MIEPASGSTAAASPFRELHARKVFRMTHSSRMAGSVPVWETPRGAQQRVEQTLTAVVTGDDSRSASLKGALAYQNPRPGKRSEPLQEFGFGDLVDMVNPLQQLPRHRPYLQGNNRRYD